MLRSITRPLAYFDKDLQVVPGLAESWDISDDGQTITFHLKDGITYSDGTPITADDFVFSWKRLIDPREAAGYSYVMADVKGGEDLLTVDTETATDADITALLDAFGVAAPDDKTFVVTLARPAAYFVYIATLWVTVPQQEDFNFGEADGYMSSGPMKMTEWNHQSNIVLEQNENWTAGDPPKIARIEHVHDQDRARTLAAYEAGELDVAGVPTQEITRIQDDPVLSTHVVQGDVLSIYYFGFDLKTLTVRHQQREDAPSVQRGSRQGDDGSPRPSQVLARRLTACVPPGMPVISTPEFYRTTSRRQGRLRLGAD